METWLQRAWLRRGAPARLLWPISLVLGLLAFLRRLAFRSGLLGTHKVRVPVVVVGNVVAGGSGKTPVVQAIVAHLKAQGIATGVVSRGYGRRTTGCREVLADSNPLEVGDEPLLIARSCGVAVFVAERRIEAARALLAAHPATEAIVCDDGLQHFALHRDLEVCVFDDRGVGNGWLLPAGPLRERWPRKVDFVIRTAGTSGIEGFLASRSLADHAVGADGSVTLLNALTAEAVTAVAGIAKPEAFFSMLRDAGLTVGQAISRPDHDDFSAPIHALHRVVVCTEKDAAKLWRTHPGALAVPLQLRIADAFWHAFDAHLHAKLSSADGSQTD